MTKKIEFEIDENVIVMQAFVWIIRKCYENKGMYRDPKAVRKIRKALINPEHYCRLDIDPNKVFADYEKLEMSVDVEGYDLYREIDVDQLTRDILNVVEGIIDSPDDFGDTPFVNAGKWLEMINDKLCGYYKTGEFGKGHDDSYYIEVLDEQMKIYKPCNTDDTNSTDNSDSVENVKKELVEAVKTELLSEITQEIPKAFERTMYTNLKNVIA